MWQDQVAGRAVLSPQARRWLASSALLCLLAWCGIACDSNPTGLAAQPSSPGTGALHTGPATISAIPVRMHPQAEIDPGFKGARAAAFAGLPDVEASLAGVVKGAREAVTLPWQAGKAASAASEVRVIPASAFDATLPHNLIQGQGGYAVFRPFWRESAVDGVEDLAYGMYYADLSGFTGAQTLGLNWAEQGPPHFDGKYWVGLAQWGQGRWAWFEGPLDSVVTLETLAPYLDHQGRALVALAVVHPANVVVLRELRFGETERRGTGVAPEPIFLPGPAPPLYVPPLPEHYSLAEAMAPVNDQLTWNACTAFSLGDGAYNYELGQLYGHLGWNLAQPEFRVSPKFMYIETGKAQDWPPGPSYGRVLHSAAEELAQIGIALEVHAPYDLVYADNWSAEALADAALLKTTDACLLPCNSADDIPALKAVLALHQHPIFLNTRYDPDLLNYDDTIWEYTGPNLGAHALLLVGYDDRLQAFLARNSWGPAWGIGGYCWVSYGTLYSHENPTCTCGYIIDDFDPEVAQHFLGAAAGLAPPANLAAVDGAAPGVITLSWDSVAGATGYRIYRDGKENELARTGETAYADTAVADFLTHTYWVRAEQGGTLSPYSAPEPGYIEQPVEIHGVAPTRGAEGQVIYVVPTVYYASGAAYDWNFGQAGSPQTSTDPVPRVVLGEAGAYQASLKVVSSVSEDEYSFTITVEPNQAPAAVLTLQTDNPVVNSGVEFSAALSTDPDGNIVLYEWDFDGNTVIDLVTTESTASYQFTEGGRYNAIVQIMDDAGAYAVASVMFIVNPYNSPPWTSLQVEHDYGIPPFTVQLDASGSGDLDGEVVDYAWDFEGDGVYDCHGAELAKTAHTYTGAGCFTLELRITDDGGAQATEQHQITVGVAGLATRWSLHAVHTWDTQETDALFAAALIAGKPAIMVQHVPWRGLDWMDDSLEYYAAGTAVPAAPADWSRWVLEPEAQHHFGACPEGIGMAAQPGGGACLAYYAEQQGYASGNPEGWAIQALGGGFTYVYCSDLALVDGRPAIAFAGYSDYDSADFALYYAQARVPEPSSSADWDLMQVDAGLPAPYQTRIHAVSLAEIADKPYIAYTRGIREPGSPSTPFIYYPVLAYASVPAPGGPADWRLQLADAGPCAPGIDMAVCDGKPALVYTAWAQPRLLCSIATSSAPYDPGDFIVMTVDDHASVAGCAAIALVAGRLAIASGRTLTDHQLNYYEAMVEVPHRSSEWRATQVVTGSTGLSGNPRLIDAGGQPAIILCDTQFDALLYFQRTP